MTAIKEAGKGWWRMKDGTAIRIKNMTDSHLTATIAMLERNAPKAATALYFSMGAYAEDHDSMGGVAAAEGANELLDARGDPAECAEAVYPKYAELIEERDRRAK